jgi:hypothetical protein
MVQNPGEFSKQSANPLCSLRDVDIQQFLYRQREALLVGHHADVVETIKVRESLQIRAILNELLGAAMQQANMGIGSHNLFAIEFQNQPQHAVGSGMLRPEIDCVVPHLTLVWTDIAGGLVLGAQGIAWVNLMGKGMVDSHELCPLQFGGGGVFA